MARIHPTAVVEDGARLGTDVELGPYSVVGREVVLGDGVVLGAHSVVEGRTSIGARTKVSPFATIGGPPQDISYRDEPTGVTIGEDCIIRENATVNRGTARGKGMTTVGSRVYMMVGAHVAHDCVVGDNVILVNCATLGGHCEVGDNAILGGLSAVQQRVKVGAFAFIGGHSGILAHLIPYGMAVGRGARLAGYNIVGMRRQGFDRAMLQTMRTAYDMLFNQEGSVASHVEAVEARFGEIPQVRRVTDFIRSIGNSRLCTPAGKTDDEGGDSERVNGDG